MDDREIVRDLYYARYVTTHSGLTEGVHPRVLMHDIVRHLGRKDGAVVDIGCGQGDLVRVMLSAGYANVKGVDRSPEQVAIAQRAGLPVERGDAVDVLGRYSRRLTAVTATDFFEHLTRDELFDLLPRIAECLQPGGVLIGRVPNAVSPFGGRYRHGDVTHESWFTPRSVRQLALNAGFEEVDVYACPPTVHGAVSAGRALLWKACSGAMKLVLAAETGVTRGHIVTQNLVFVARKARASALTGDGPQPIKGD